MTEYAGIEKPVLASGTEPVCALSPTPAAAPMPQYYTTNMQGGRPLPPMFQRLRDQTSRNGGLVDAADLAWTLQMLPSLLAQARQRRGLTIRQAAEEIGINPSVLAWFECQRSLTHAFNDPAAIVRWLERVTPPTPSAPSGE